MTENRQVPESNTLPSVRHVLTVKCTSTTKIRQKIRQKELHFNNWNSPTHHYNINKIVDIMTNWDATIISITSVKV